MSARTRGCVAWLAGALVLAMVAMGCRSQQGPVIAVANPTTAARQLAQVAVTDAVPLPERLIPTSIATAIVSAATSQPSSAATSASIPSSTALPTATPVPILRQLTTGGCCTQPFWSPDSRQVLFIDKPGEASPVGIWGVDVTQPQAEPVLVTERIEDYTADAEYLVDADGDTTVIERVADGTRWTVPAGGRSVSISPGGLHIAWQVSDFGVPFERRVSELWVANLDGSEARQVASLPRGGLSGWVSDEALLLSGRASLDSRDQVLSILSLVDGTKTELVRTPQLRGARLSPDGRWLVYYVTFSEDAAANGLWLVRTDGKETRQVNRDLFGAYQWRDDDRLLIVPFRPEVTYHQIWELNPETNQAQPLTDPNLTPFKIANGDWRVSPDGRYVAFVESSDRNIWVLKLSK